MAITKANFSHITNIEHGYTGYSIFIVDFINAMDAETGDPDTSSAVAGLEITRRTIEQAIESLNVKIVTIQRMQSTTTSKASKRHQFLLMGMKHG